MSGGRRAKYIHRERSLIKATGSSGPGYPAGGANGEFCHFWGGKFSAEIIDVARVIDELYPADRTANTHTRAHVYLCMCVCVSGYTTWEACVSYIGVVVPAENGVRRPPIGLPLAGPGVARCSHRFRQSLADSAPAAILNDSGINTRGAEKKVHAGPPPPPVPSAVSHSRSISVRTPPPLSLALISINRFMQPPTPLHHHLLFPPRGTLTPFRRRLPPVPLPPPPFSFPSHLPALPPMASPAQQRQPSTTQSKGVIGPFTCIRAEERMHVRYTYAGSKIIEKILGESGVAGVPPWRRRHRRPRPSPPRVPSSFSSPPRGLCREYMRFSLALSPVRCYVARYVFNTGQLVGK